MAAAEAQSKPDAVDTTVVKKAPERPNKADLDKEIKTIEEEIAARKKIVDDVRSKLDGLKEASAAGRDKSKVEDDKLKKMREESKKLVEARRKLYDEMIASRDKVKKLRDQHDTVRKNLKDVGVFSLEKIDERIKERDYYMSTHSLTLKEEKEIHAEIKALSNSRKLVGEVDVVRQKKEAEEERAKELSKKHDEAKAVLDKAKKAEKAQQEKRDALRPKGVESSEIQKWKDSRTKARADLDELYGKIKSMREDFKKKEDVFYKFIKERRKEQEAARKEQEAARKEEDKLRRLQREEEEQESMHAESFAAIDQLTTYLSKFQNGDAKPEAAAVEEFKPAEGVQLIGKATRGFDEDVFGTKKAGKGKKSKGGKKKGAAFNLDLGLMKEFDSLKITAPLSAEDIPAALKALEAKKAELEKDKENKKVQRQKKIAEMTTKGEEGEKTEEKKEEAAVDESDKDALFKKFGGTYLITKGEILLHLSVEKDEDDLEFTMRCVIPNPDEEGAYIFNDTFMDPECSGRWAVKDGAFSLYGSSPKKFFHTYETSEGGWTCTNNCSETMVKKEMKVTRPKKEEKKAADEDEFDAFAMM